MNWPKVSIIILNWHGVTDTIECLESLKKITYPNYDVIVADNNSGGDDVRILREKYSDYIYLIENDKNYGFPEGNNIPMRYALNKGSGYLLLLNNDTIVDPNFVTELVRVAESDASIGIVGSKIFYYYYPNIVQCAGGKIRWWLGDIETFGGEDKGQFNKNKECDFVFGTSFLIKKQVPAKIGMFDPYFFFGIEEFDYCTKAKRAEFKVIFAPESKVWHKVGASSSKLGQYPDTQLIIKKSRGTRQNKYTYRLFKRYLPPIIFIFPFLAYTVLDVPTWRQIVQLIARRDWKTLNRGAKRFWRSRFDALLHKANKNSNPI